MLNMKFIYFIFQIKRLLDYSEMNFAEMSEGILPYECGFQEDLHFDIDS